MAYKDEFMEEAIRLSAENLNHKQGGPFGAVVVKNGKIISRAVNTVVRDHDPTAHAEINAIREACEKLGSFQLDGCEIYSSCEPCPMCLGAIYWARPVNIYFAAGREDARNAGFDDSFIYHEIEKKVEDRNIPMKQRMKDEAREVFDKWNQMEVKPKY